MKSVLMGLSIAHVSTFPSMRCGIASYANDLILFIPECSHVKYALHYGTNFSPDALASAAVTSIDAVRELGRTVSMSSCHIVDLQHEFGIWGGEYGEHIHAFLDEVDKPIVATLHTTYGSGSRSVEQLNILRRLVSQSARVVVLTVASKRNLCLSAQVTGDNVTVIQHGVPSVTFRPINGLGTSLGSAQPLRLFSIGYFRRDKGIEITLNALRRLKGEGVRFSYVIAGEPQRQFAGQDEYQQAIRMLIHTLDLSEEVEIDDRYLTVQEQVDVIQAGHVGIFAYQEPAQASSGTVPLVLACGRPVICTPFEYALVKQQQLPGVTVARDFDADSIADSLKAFLKVGANWQGVTRALYSATRDWTWDVIGQQYLNQYHLAAASR